MSGVEKSLKAYYDGEMKDRAGRALGDDRTAGVRTFAEHLRATGARSLLEVGCGACRDGLVLARSRAAPTGDEVPQPFPTGVVPCAEAFL